MKYYDSLRPPSASAEVVATALIQKAGWGESLPPVVSNTRFQEGGWECGLFSLQFLEEAVREARGELVLRPQLNISSMINRINQFVSRCQRSLHTAPSRAVGRARSAIFLDSQPTEEELFGPEAVEQLTAATDKAIAGAVPVFAQKVAGLPVLAPVPVPVEPKPSAPPQLTSEQAEAAKAVCSKCLFTGCSHCMGQWFVPVATYKQ